MSFFDVTYYFGLNYLQRYGYESDASKIPQEFSELGIKPCKNTQTFVYVPYVALAYSRLKFVFN